MTIYAVTSLPPGHLIGWTNIAATNDHDSSHPADGLQHSVSRHENASALVPRMAGGLHQPPAKRLMKVSVEG
ncbi:hypothetical protein [Nonomuraea sp. JJY05]|uniref:hypothetical protein n=1 Tax=Nonomuraea sp. JJY05 TaxID=3350255 RepID=UPI00373E788A